MDKITAAYLIISAVMCTGICKYCGDTRVTAVSAVQETEPTTETTIQTTVSDDKCSTSDVSVEYAFLDDFGIPHVVVKSNTEQIYGYSLKVVYYNGTDEETAEEDIDIDDVVPAGMTSGLDRFIPKHDGTKYINAAVTRAKFIDREENYPPLFKKRFDTLREAKPTNADAKCGFMDISAPEVKASRGESDLSDIRFVVTNNSERAIKNIEFLAAEYDANGEPVSAVPNGYIRSHIRKLSWKDADIGAKAQKTAASAMALNKDCTQVQLIVEHIEFQDRGVWSNPDTLDWIISQGGNKK